MIEIPSKVPIKAWTDGVELDQGALQQLFNVSRLPVVGPHVAVMPDVHWGIGATVGSVIPTTEAIIPAAVGVDIGCGMMATRTSLTLNDLEGRLPAIRDEIERTIPVGGPGVKGSWGDTRFRGIPTPVEIIWRNYLAKPFADLHSLHPKIKANPTVEQLGTLGTGNHFIEVCYDEEGRIWVMLHSGSRGVGNRIGTYFIQLAKEDYYRHHVSKLPDIDLAYLEEGSEHFDDYVAAVGWAQQYALLNRKLMMGSALIALQRALPDKVEGQYLPMEVTSEAVNCHHNYVQQETHSGRSLWITRKGAVSAGLGELGIIPGSMGVRSFIVRGKGNPESFMSCSHGAGRRMSRGQAKRQFTVEDHATATAGVECRKDQGVLDETPGAYKDIDAVMAAQADLVEIVHTLKQVVNVKG